jgi:hypothetical protein
MGGDDGLLTSQEVADIFRVSAKTVRRWAVQGKLSSHDGLFRESDVLAFLR